MSKALIIGNGPSVLEKKLGKRIDSNEFDKIIRINRWKFDTDGSEHKTDHSKFVGTRCDYWVVNDLHMGNKLVFKKHQLYEHVLICMPNFKWDPIDRMLPQVEQIEKRYNNISFIPPSYEDDVNRLVNFNPKWPSTGIMSIHFAINHFDEVYLYGFDTYDKKYDTLHYFEGVNSHYGKNKFKDANNKDHSPDREKEYLNHMIKYNKIKILT